MRPESSLLRRRPLRPRSRTWLVALASALLLGCSTVRLAYNNLPELGYWWLDGYLDFNAAQSQRVRDELARLQAWHRREELPRLSELLSQSRTLALQGVTPNQACETVERVRERLLAVAAQAEPAAAEIASSLDESQIRTLERKYAKVNAAWRKEWLALDPSALQDKRFDLQLERSEDFYGPLTAAQRALLRRQVAESAFDASRVDANRRQRQQEAIAMLRRLQAERPSPAAAQAAVREWVMRFAEPPPGPGRDYQQALLREGCRNTSALHDSASAEQRERAARRLRSYEDDARSLARAD